jgi:hypothetical protein
MLASKNDSRKADAGVVTLRPELDGVGVGANSEPVVAPTQGSWSMRAKEEHLRRQKEVSEYK